MQEGGLEISGSPTEKAILDWGVKVLVIIIQYILFGLAFEQKRTHITYGAKFQLGMKFDVVRSESIILHVSPFNSTKKRGGLALRGRVITPKALLDYII